MNFLVCILAAVSVLGVDRMSMADRLFNRGEFAAALEEYRTLAGDTSVAGDELAYRLAECERALGHSAEARKAYGELLAKFPTSKHADRARLMRALAGNDDEKKLELRALDSDRVAAAVRAAALYYLGSAENDVKLLERSVTLDPKGKYAVYANFHRASLMVKSTDEPTRRKAVELLFQISIEDNSELAEEALYLAAVQSYSDRKYANATGIFRRYLKKYPDGRHAADVKTMTAWSDYLAGRFADSVAMCGDVESDDFSYLRAACAYSCGELASAEKLFNAYLERYPNGKYRERAELPLTRMKFDAAEKSGDKAKILENAKRSYAISGLSGDALRLAWAYESAEMTDDAIREYQSVAAKFPKTDDAAEALFRKAMIDIRAGRWSAADLALSEALASGKNSKRKAESLYWRGMAATQCEHYEEGVKALNEAIAVGLSLDHMREAKLVIADYDLRSGRVDAAKEAYSKLVREGALDRMSASKALAVGKLLSGDDARKCANALTKSDSAEWRQAGYALLGAVEESAGSFAAAVEAYRKCLDEKATVEDLAKAALALGLLEAKLGEKEAADATLRRAVELNAKDVHARALAYVTLAENCEAKGDIVGARGYATVVVSLFSDKELVARAQRLLDDHPEEGK